MNIWQGKKVRLRAVEEKDLDGYFDREGDVDSIAQRNGDRLLFPVSRTLMEERVHGLAKKGPFDQECFLIIEDLEGNAVGNINTHSTNPIDGIFKYGLGIRKGYRGHGYAKEAIVLMLRFYFMEMNYRKVEVEVYAFNPESVGLHESLGFVLEGTLRKSHYANGAYHDVMCYGMLKEEFMHTHKDYSVYPE